MVGAVAEYIYTSSIRPMKEAALLGAIAMTAGLAGRQYNISGTGLNQYLILLAPTGSGKEGAANGIGRLMTQVRKRIPGVTEYRGAAHISSGQALLKDLAKQPCQFAILGEIGFRLQQMADPRANSAEKKLQEVLLDLYNKSGGADEMGAMSYSDQDKNVARVASPALTVLGESTPESFFVKLNEDHIASGLLPRFIFLEYTGNRPPKNKLSAFADPSAELVSHVAALAETAIRMQTNNVICQITVDPEAQKLLDAFDKACDLKVDSNGETHKHLWSRADLMAIRISGLLAVGCNHLAPVVTAELVSWAINFINMSVSLIAGRFEKGQVGDGELTYESDLIKTVTRYWALTSETKVKTYKIPARILEEPVIPYTYLRRSLKHISSFKNDRRGLITAIKGALQDACEAQILIKLPPATIQTRYGLAADLYTVGPAFPD